MGDEQSHRSSSADDADVTGDEPDDSLEPGGGPRRVVSEQSVEDILDSLEETTDSAGDDGGRTLTSDESDVATGDRSDDRDVEPPVIQHGDDATDSNGSATEEPDSDGGSGSTPSTEGRTQQSPTAATTNGDDAETSTRDDSSQPAPDVIADRLERTGSDVTGADVRAAETGAGRESTPEVDEIDLTMDDLEGTVGDAESAGGSTAGPDRSGGGELDDARSLAGSEGGDDDPAAESDDTASDSGFVGRLKRLFFGSS